MSHVRARPRAALLLLVGLVLALLLGALATTPAAGAASSPAGTLLGHLNDARTARGLAPLATAEDLEAVGTAHSRTMADSGNLHHNPSLGSDVSNWRVVAENVGHGPDADQLHRMFMDSPVHAANILDERVTQVGVGVVTVGGQLWVTQVFRQPVGSSTATPRATTPRTASSPQASAPEPPTGPPAPDPTSEPPVPAVGVATATPTRTAPAPAAIGGAAATITTTAPVPVEEHDGGGGLLAAAARWVATLF